MYPFQVIELDAAMDEEQVADVFVRINSEVPLNQADFILTLMSVFAIRPETTGGLRSRCEEADDEWSVTFNW